LNPGDIRALYEFAIETRLRFLASFRDLGWEEFTRDRGASWNSMRGVFIHILEVEDSWLHYDARGIPWPFGDRDPSVFTSFDQVETYDRELTAKTRKLLENLTPEVLARQVIFGWRDGKVKSSTENILVHSFIDELAHLGELVCLMWQSDVKPPWTNWMEGRYRPV